MSGLEKKHLVVVAFTMACALGGTIAGHTLVESAKNSCLAKDVDINLSKDFFPTDNDLILCPETGRNALYMMAIGWSSGISAMIAGAVLVGRDRKKKTPNNPAP